jgi:putative membrane protein insertion efficiency factor
MNVSRTSRPALEFPAQAAIALVRLYQRHLSFLKPPTCRYYPSCSEYAVRAIAERGLLKGFLLASWRLLRCNPFSPGGHDPGPWVARSAERRRGSQGPGASEEAG